MLSRGALPLLKQFLEENQVGLTCAASLPEENSTEFHAFPCISMYNSVVMQFF